MSRTLRIALTAAPLLLAISVGTSSAGPPPGGAKTVTLTLGNPEKPGRPSSEIAEAFAAKVKALTKGKVIVKVTYDAGRPSDDTPNGQVEANLIRLVRSGKAQLAIV